MSLIRFGKFCCWRSAGRSPIATTELAPAKAGDGIAAWGEEHLEFLRRFLPYYHGVPSGLWLTILMNRVDPALFSACFSDWVRASWPDVPELVAVDGLPRT